MNKQTVIVRDPLVRLFHWLLAGCFLLAWWLEDEWLPIHLLAGATLFGLLIFRLFWGLIGPRWALFSSLPLRPSQVRAHIQQLWHGQAVSGPAHTPAGSLMIITLLTLLFVLSFTGIALLALQSGVGPLADAMAGVDAGIEPAITEIHGFLADAIAWLVLLHIGGVVIESLLQKRNLLALMIHGRMRLSGKR